MNIIKKTIGKFLENKKMLYSAGAVILVIICIIFIIASSGPKQLNPEQKDFNKTIAKDIEIEYKHGQNIIIKDLKKNFVKEKNITIENTGKEYKSFGLEWKNVKNTLKNKNSLKYEIIGEGPNAKNYGPAPMPTKDKRVFIRVLVLPDTTQKYILRVIYTKDKKEKESFSGTLETTYQKTNLGIKK